MTSLRSIQHLVRRALTSFSNAPVTPNQSLVVRDILQDAEFRLWCDMDPRDQRHSLDVLERFDVLAPSASRPWRAAALLHDVGKNASRLGWLTRICATVVGPKGRRFRSYHDHETIGVALLRDVGAEDVASILEDLSVCKTDDEMSTALRLADDI